MILLAAQCGKGIFGWSWKAVGRMGGTLGFQQLRVALQEDIHPLLAGVVCGNEQCGNWCQVKPVITAAFVCS